MEAFRVAEAAATTRPLPQFTEVWQLPTLLVSLALFAAGMYLVWPEDTLQQYDEALTQISQRVDAGQYAVALKALAKIGPEMEQQPSTLRGRYALVYGDALYLGQRAEGWDLPDNHRRIVASYEAAQQHGVKLDGTHLRRLTDSLAAIGKADEALEILARMGESGAERRQALLKQMITAAMAREPADDTMVESLLDRLAREEGLLPANRAWLIVRRAERLAEAGDRPDAIDYLLRSIVRVQADTQTPTGELKVMLGRMYLDEGHPADAERWLLRAQKQLDTEDPLNARVLVGLGRLRFDEGNPIEALEHYLEVVRRFPQSEEYLDALMGKAESEARRGAVAEALADYDEAVKAVNKQPKASSSLRERLIESLAARHDQFFTLEQYETALRFLQPMQGLFAGALPSEVMLRLAVTHEQVARQQLGLAPDEPVAEAAVAKAGDEARARAREHFALAADHFLRHAHAVRSQDVDVYVQSLWNAGEYFDHAGLHKESAKVFEDFVGDQSDHPKRVEAIYRLAQARQANGQFEAATALYKKLVEEHPKTTWASASHVPLARCYLAIGGEREVSLAEQVLTSVVENHEVLRPESREYREALIELGQLHYRRGGEGDFEKAIQRLEEVIARYGNEGNRAELHFQLGDAYRKSVRQIDEMLGGSLPPSQESRLQAERATRLDKARRHFNSVIDLLGRRDPQQMDALEQLYLRNSYFYRADCAYDLRQYEGPAGAIALYEKARQHYDKDPAVLVALVQIVNSYAEMGEWELARKANERAKVFLERIPESVFDDPNLPMSRRHWQRWLDFTSELAAERVKLDASP